MAKRSGSRYTGTEKRRRAWARAALSVLLAAMVVMAVILLTVPAAGWGL